MLRLCTVAVNRERSCLKNSFNRCIEWKKFEGANPVKGIQLVKEIRGRLRWLDYDEEERLLAAELPSRPGPSF